jgi:hypothetical protein
MLSYQKTLRRAIDTTSRSQTQILNSTGRWSDPFLVTCWQNSCVGHLSLCS